MMKFYAAFVLTLVILSCFCSGISSESILRRNREQRINPSGQIPEEISIRRSRQWNPVPRQAITFNQGPAHVNTNSQANLPARNTMPSQFPGFRSKLPPDCKKRKDWLVDPKCGKNREGGFCEDDEDYDATVRQRFDELISQSTYIQEVIKNELLIDPEPLLNLTRFGPFISEVTVCPARETIIYPKRAQTATNDWVFILNQQHMRQGVRVEICARENQECRVGGTSLPHTQCRQKYIYRKLLSMDARGSNIVPETVLLPSCCVCYVSNEFAVPRTGFGPNECSD